MDFTKKKSILVNLITSTEFNDSLEWKGVFEKESLLDLLREYEKCGKYWLKKQWELGHASVSYAILNQYVSRSTSHSYYLTLLLPISKYAKYVIRLTQHTQCHPEPSYTSMALKLSW